LLELAPGWKSDRLLTHDSDRVPSRGAAKIPYFRAGASPANATPPTDKGTPIHTPSLTDCGAPINAARVKVCAFGLSAIPVGKHNIKDPRLDETHKLVEAKKKAYAQVDVVGDAELVDADCVVTDEDGFLELVFRDVDFIENRLERDPSEEEKAALLKLKIQLEDDHTVHDAGLGSEDREALAIHSFTTDKPVIVASAEELAQPDSLMVRVFRESGWICFLTVGGSENKAWPIPAATTAWEAGGAIHSDIQHGFIRAEIIGYDDFIEAGGETLAKRADKQRLETKTYVIQDYDLTNFRFNK